MRRGGKNPVPLGFSTDRSRICLGPGRYFLKIRPGGREIGRHEPLSFRMFAYNQHQRR